jgi:hypothetical protein
MQITLSCTQRLAGRHVPARLSVNRADQTMLHPPPSKHAASVNSQIGIFTITRLWKPINFNSKHFFCRIERDSSVDIATRYWLDGRGSISSRVKRFSLFHNVQTSPGAHPDSYLIPGALSSGVKRPGRDANHSPPSSASVKKDGAILTLPQTSAWRSAYPVFPSVLPSIRFDWFEKSWINFH